MNKYTLLERGLEVVADATRPMHEVRQAAQQSKKLAIGTADTANSVGLEDFLLARGLQEIDTQDINAFDNRAHAAMRVYPERAHEIAATQDLVYEIDSSRAVLIGHQILDIVVEHESQST